MVSQERNYIINAFYYALQTMGVKEFKDTVACVMRVTWAAAAGNLHLACTPNGCVRENSIYTGTRSRQSSTGQFRHFSLPSEYADRSGSVVT